MRLTVSVMPLSVFAFPPTTVFGLRLVEAMEKEYGVKLIQVLGLNISNVPLPPMPSGNLQTAKYSPLPFEASMLIVAVGGFQGIPTTAFFRNKLQIEGAPPLAWSLTRSTHPSVVLVLSKACKLTIGIWPQTREVVTNKSSSRIGLIILYAEKHRNPGHAQHPIENDGLVHRPQFNPSC